MAIKLIGRKVIGIFGNKQHGKDTLARLLSTYLVDGGKRVQTFSLADPLKRAAKELLGMPVSIAFGDDSDTTAREKRRIEWVRYGKNAREWLQWIGTELGREQIDGDLWIDRAVDTVVNDIEGHHFFIISDCRFHNERNNLDRKLRERFIEFHTVRIHRPDMPVNLDHPSESEVASMRDDQFDRVTVNDGNLEHLKAKARTLADDLLATAGA